MRVIKAVLKFALTVVIVLALFSVAALIYNERLNDNVKLTEYTFSHPELPESFDGYKILVISDLHNAPFADQIEDIVEDREPDLVVFTGDMVQLPGHNVDEAARLAKDIRSMGIPMYAVSGNHETQNEDYNNIMGRLWGDGAIPLEDDSDLIEKDGESILIIGVQDPKDDVVDQEDSDKMLEEIGEELQEEPCFTILLSHRADLYPQLKDSGVDLILSGHLHGGIIRLPFVGGVIGQDMYEGGRNTYFPKYDYGYFKEGDSAAMIVSGGCDQNPDKKRYFNPPEVVMVRLEVE